MFDSEIFIIIYQETRTDGDPELLDDSEFYQQLLKEFFETVDPSSSGKTFRAQPNYFCAKIHR